MPSASAWPSLHQLRGRVGRGVEGLDLRAALQGPARRNRASARLSIMRETEDGFRIAEEDLKLRGEGELLGTRQSGTPGFQVAGSRPMPTCWRSPATMPACC